MLLNESKRNEVKVAGNYRGLKLFRTIQTPPAGPQNDPVVYNFEPETKFTKQRDAGIRELVLK